MTTKGQYLRTKWRETGVVLPANAIGRGIARGSALFASAGYQLAAGGLIYMSVHQTGSATSYPTSGSGCVKLTADSILASVYGTNGFAGGGTGYKILPLQVFPRWVSAVGAGSAAYSVLGMYGSITTADDSTVRFYCQIPSQTNDNIASYFSAIFYWVGFIVSTP